MNYLLYIFDLDGTIMNSEFSIMESLTLTARDMDCSPEGLVGAKSMIGQPLSDILSFLGVRDLEKGKDLYREYYFSFLLEERPYPGVADILKQLHNRVLLSICTNKGSTGTRMTLDNNDLLAYFDTVQTVDDGISKPDVLVWKKIQQSYQSQGKSLEPGDCLMIGDSPTDSQFAINCGMDYAHVDWGFYPAESLKTAPQYLISKAAQLLDILEQAIELPITDELDLHGFLPAVQMKVVDSYLQAARDKGLTELRIIHGKGRGVQRTRLHALLDKREDISAFKDAPPFLGGLGATLVTLK